MVKELESVDDFKNAIASSKLTIVDFFATWCGPCKAIAPKLEDLAESNPNIQVVKVDVDKLEDLSQEQGITAMPTFLFFKNGSKLDSIRGANIDSIKALVEKLQ